MKKIRILVLLIAMIAMGFTNPITTIKKSLKVDVESSSITWKGYKPTGSHTGTIALESGNLEMKGDKVKGGSFTVDMSSIIESEGNKRLEKHLKSKDFFEIEVYATSKFEITGSKITDGKTYVTGNLTIKDVTKEITFPAIITENDTSVTLESETFQINRANFNVKFKSKTFFNDLKEKFINDEFDLQVTIVAKKINS